MAIIRWQPLDLPSLFNRVPTVMSDNEWPDVFLANDLDVYETDDEVVVKAPVPGIPTDKVNVTFEDGVLRIEGHYEESDEDKKKKKAVYRTRKAVDFNYATTLPRAVDPNKISAEVNDGIIMVTAPIAPEAKPRKINLKVKGKA